jgi:hypothetical protein
MHSRTNAVADTDQIVERLRSIEEELRDLAYDRLRAASESGDANALADEKRVLQARRAIERAINALSADGRSDDR